MGVMYKNVGVFLNVTVARTALKSSRQMAFSVSGTCVIKKNPSSNIIAPPFNFANLTRKKGLDLFSVLK